MGYQIWKTGCDHPHSDTKQEQFRIGNFLMHQTLQMQDVKLRLVTKQLPLHIQSEWLQSHKDSKLHFLASPFTEYQHDSI